MILVSENGPTLIWSMTYDSAFTRIQTFEVEVDDDITYVGWG